MNQTRNRGSEDEPTSRPNEISEPDKMIYAKSQTILLTQEIVKQAKTEEKRIELRDTREKGLVLRVSRTGQKTFVDKFRAGKNQVTLTLGSPDELDLSDARLLVLEKRLERKRSMSKPVPSSDPVVTLQTLLFEGRKRLSTRPKGGTIWTKRDQRAEPDAVGTIKNVFSAFLDRNVLDITIEEINEAVRNHTKQGSSKTAVLDCTGQEDTEAEQAILALGTASRALSYLTTLFDWAAHRNKFRELGLRRNARLEVADVSQVARPAYFPNPRERYLEEEEMGSLFPLFWNHGGDEGAAAHCFMCLTFARKSEVQDLDWNQIKLAQRVWNRRVKGGESVPIGLPDEVVRWLKELPSYIETGGKGPVFRNTKKDRFRSWSRKTKQLQVASGTENWTRHDLRRTSVVHAHGLIDDQFPLWEVLSHAAPDQSEVSADAVVHHLFNNPEAKGAMRHYAPGSALPVANNRITRTRGLCTKLLAFYKGLAAAAAGANAPRTASACTSETPKVRFAASLSSQLS